MNNFKKTAVGLGLGFAVASAALATPYQYRFYNKGVRTQTGGSAPAMPVTLSVSVADFGLVENADYTVVTRTVTVTNPSNSSKTITLSGSVPEVSVSNGCTVLPGNATCTLTFAYTPSTRRALGELGQYSVGASGEPSRTLQVVAGATWNAAIFDFEATSAQNPESTWPAAANAGAMEVGVSEAANGSGVARFHYAAGVNGRSSMCYNFSGDITEGRFSVSRRAVAGAWTAEASDSNRSGWKTYAGVAMPSTWTRTSYTGYTANSRACAGIFNFPLAGAVRTADMDLFYVAWR